MSEESTPSVKADPAVFCGNPKCRFHDTYNAGILIVQVGDGIEREVTRCIFYVQKETEFRERFLCSDCIEKIFGYGF